MLNGRLLADGGMMDPVPSLADRRRPRRPHPRRLPVRRPDGSPGSPTGRRTAPLVLETAEAQPVEEWSDRFRRSAADLLDRDLVRSLPSRFGGGPEEGAGDGPVPGAAPGVDTFEKLPEGLSKWDMMNLSLEAMQSLLTRYRLAGYPPDVLVTVPKDACRTLDFHRADEMVALGRRSPPRRSTVPVGDAPVGGGPGVVR